MTPGRVEAGGVELAYDEQGDGPPVVLVHDTCGHITQPMLTCPHCHGEVSPANTHSEPGPGSRAGSQGTIA